MYWTLGSCVGLTGEPVPCGILNSALFRASLWKFGLPQKFHKNTFFGKFGLEPMIFCLDSSFFPLIRQFLYSSLKIAKFGIYFQGLTGNRIPCGILDSALFQAGLWKFVESGESIPEPGPQAGLGAGQ